MGTTTAAFRHRLTNLFTQLEGIKGTGAEYSSDDNRQPPIDYGQCQQGKDSRNTGYNNAGQSQTNPPLECAEIAYKAEHNGTTASHLQSTGGKGA